VGPEELLALLGWIPQEQWQRQIVQQVVDDLSLHNDGSMVRRWFRRPQVSLGRRTPLEALRLAKAPEDPLLQELRRLAGVASG
jgi:hypothetical protein